MENAGLCQHLQFTRQSRGYPGDEAQWVEYLAKGGLAIHTRILAREHTDCAECAKVLAELDPE